MDENALYNEVEDIMCDQGIISKELNVVGFEGKSSYIFFSATRLRIAVAVFARTLMPTVLRLYYVYLRNQQLVVDNLKHHLLPSVVAFLANSLSGSLASVQKRIALPSISVIKDQDQDQDVDQRIRNEDQDQDQEYSIDRRSCVEGASESFPERSVDCQVLAAPDGEILADVIFIHGLHGGIDKTWKQGQWRHEGHKLRHQSPVRSKSTGNLHVPPNDLIINNKQSLKRTVSDIYWRIPYKRARKSEGDVPTLRVFETNKTGNNNLRNDGSLLGHSYHNGGWLKPSDCEEFREFAGKNDCERTNENRSTNRLFERFGEFEESQQNDSGEGFSNANSRMFGDFQETQELENEEGFSNCWPQDWLPKDCPGVRVIALNYTTDVLWCPVWKKKRIRTDMVERSDEMIQELSRLGVGKKPIIWVGHSKGGLFIKQIIMNAWEKHSNRPEVYDIFRQSKGIMFYSVPHRGSSLADFTLPLLRRSVELIEIQRNCEFVLDLHKRFLEICQEGHFQAEIFSFIETSFTLMSFIYLKIVAYESADPGIGEKCEVPLDHREICKPAGRDCFLYLELVKLIKRHVHGELVQS